MIQVANRRVIILIAVLASLNGCASLSEKRFQIEATASVPEKVDSVSGLSGITEGAVVQPISDTTLLATLAPSPSLTPLDHAELPDLWARIRAGFALQDLETPDVERFANHFARTGWMEHLGPRARRYLYFLVVEAENRKLPSELALLPIIESGLNPNARSPANAVGLCQFIPATGKRFGLTQSVLADRRQDVTCIAGMFDYLGQNAAMFGGDWHLALASYNWGENAVARAIEKNRAKGLPTDYLSLTMPTETRYYVPKLQALRNIIANPH